MGALSKPHPPPNLPHQLAVDVTDAAAVHERLAALQEELHFFGVTSLALVGSVARAKATNSSDIDIVIDTVDEFALSDLCKVGRFLEGRTGAKVDVVHCDVVFTNNPLDALPEPIRRNVIRDMVSVF